MDALKGLEENLWSFWANLGKPSGSHLHDTPELMWFETPIASLPYNGVMRTCLASDVEKTVNEVFAHFEAAKKPFFWLTHPSMEPDNLEPMLEARGLSVVDEVTGMVGPLGSLPDVGELPAGIEIREVTDATEFDVVIDFIVWRWQVPEGWKTYFEELRDVTRLGQPGTETRAWVAWRGDEALAKAVTREDNGVIGLYGVATKPEARGMGLGRNICLHALRESDQGRNMMGVLHSSPMAVGLYEKMGFKTIAGFKLYAAADMHL